MPISAAHASARAGGRRTSTASATRSSADPVDERHGDVLAPSPFLRRAEGRHSACRPPSAGVRRSPRARARRPGASAWAARKTRPASGSRFWAHRKVLQRPILSSAARFGFWSPLYVLHNPFLAQAARFGCSSTLKPAADRAALARGRSHGHPGDPHTYRDGAAGHAGRIVRPHDPLAEASPPSALDGRRLGITSGRPMPDDGDDRGR